MTTAQETPADFLARALESVPTDPRQVCGPSTIAVEPLHLSVTQTWDAGSTHNTHVLENGDISVTLKRGGGRIPDGDYGTVVVSLGVDCDHDEVHFQNGNYEDGTRVDTNEVLCQAIEALVAARWSLEHASRESA